MISAAVFDISQRNGSVTDSLRQDFGAQRGQAGSRGLEFEANASLSPGNRPDGKVPDCDNVRFVPRVTLVDAHVCCQVHAPREIAPNSREDAVATLHTIKLRQR